MMLSSLQFLGHAMSVMSKKNPLTESFMAQLDVDLEGSGLSIWPHQKYSDPVHVFQPQQKYQTSGGMHGVATSLGPSEIPVNTDSVSCSPLFEIRDSQAMGPGSRSVFYAKDSTYGGQIIDMDTSYSQMSPDSLNMQLPNRTKGGQYGAKLGVMEQVPTPNSEMDFSTAGDLRQQKSPGNSYNDVSSSSHASFTPPTGDSASTSGVGSLPKGSPGASNMPTPGSLAAAASDSLFFDIADATFSSFQQSQFFAAAGPMAFGASPSPRVSAAAAAGAAPTGVSVDVAMSSTAAAAAGGGWDMGGMDAAGSSTGLSSMVTESWSDVLSSVADWSSVGGDHQGFGARPRRA
jgi:hypothetical protein